MGQIFGVDGAETGHTQACINSITFEEAEATCAEVGRRLCTVAELNSGICCGTGCWHDHRAVWTQPAGAPAPGPAPPVAVDPAQARASDALYLFKSASGTDQPLESHGDGHQGRIQISNHFTGAENQQFRLPVAPAVCEAEGCVGPEFPLCHHSPCPEGIECTFGTGCYGNWHNAFEDDQPLVSGSTVTVVREAGDLAYDCAWAQNSPCVGTPFPLAWGHWGAVAHVIKVIETGGTFVKAEAGAPILHDDRVIFERMWQGSSSPQLPFVEMFSDEWLSLGCTPDTNSNGGNCAGQERQFAGSAEDVWRVSKVSMS